ncbi:unnamed protein product, partial [marine sediment metagenome]
MKKKIGLMIVLILLAGGVFGGCMEAIVNKGLGVAEEKVVALQGEKYQELKEQMKAEGRDIKEIDQNLDGEITVGELGRAFMK